MLRGSCPEALSGFVKFHPQYPVLKVPGGAFRPPCASRSRLARRCILRTSPPRVKGKFGFGRNNSGARAISAGRRAFPQLAQSLPRGPCRPRLWRRLHNRGGWGARWGHWRRRKNSHLRKRGPIVRGGAFQPIRRARPVLRLGRKRHARRRCARGAPATAIRPCPRLRSRGGGKACGLDGRWSADEGKRRYPRAFPPSRRTRGRTSASSAEAAAAFWRSRPRAAA